MKNLDYELNTPIFDMESDDYHAVAGTFSSSQLKDALEDIEIFHQKYIAKTIERTGGDHFDVGTYFHTGVLEPHKLKTEVAVYPGTVRSGSKWEAFKKKHKGKLLITQMNASKGNQLVEMVRKSPVAMSYIKRGKPEVSIFVKLVIYRGDIYAMGNKMNYRLGREGWEEYKKALPKGVVMIVKVRADSLGEDFVLDLKSTSGNCRSERKIKDTISQYSYDLSASFYLDIFSVGLGRTMEKFIWTFASKDKFNYKSYYADDKQVLVGRSKWKKAILKIADGIATNWEFGDYLAPIGPHVWELEHITQSEIDLL